MTAAELATPKSPSVPKLGAISTSIRFVGDPVLPVLSHL
jgi:hypothetical protein